MNEREQAEQEALAYGKRYLEVVLHGAGLVSKEVRDDMVRRPWLDWHWVTDAWAAGEFHRLRELLRDCPTQTYPCR